MTTITGIRCIRTRANGTWTIVKVTTDQPGLYGIGSASDHYHGPAVVAIIEQSLAPLLIGRDASRIEDIWQSALTSGYWRHDSILNTALAAIDVALGTSRGKRPGGQSTSSSAASAARRSPATPTRAATRWRSCWPMSGATWTRAGR